MFALTLPIIFLQTLCVFVVPFSPIVDKPNRMDVGVVNGASISAHRSYFVLRKPIVLGSEISGVSLNEVGRVSPLRPAASAIQVSRSNGTFILTSLAQLKGLVHIETEEQAIAFVRLRTSRCYTYDWGGIDRAVQEVVSRHQAEDPAYGSTGCESESYWHNIKSGFHAVLSEAAYHRFPNEPLSAHVKNGEFMIERWVCVFAKSTDGTATRVEKWREIVLPDGSYTRKILVSKAPPKLPATEWIIYNRK